MIRLFVPHPDLLPGQLRSPLYICQTPSRRRAPSCCAMRSPTSNRHARASKAVVGVSIGKDMLQMRSSDNGRGGLAAHGNGVSGMRERARALGGTPAIESPLRHDTTLSLRVPLPACAAMAGAARTAAITNALRIAGSAA